MKRVPPTWIGELSRVRKRPGRRGDLVGPTPRLVGNCNTAPRPFEMPIKPSTVERLSALKKTNPRSDLRMERPAWCADVPWQVIVKRRDQVPLECSSVASCHVIPVDATCQAPRRLAIINGTFFIHPIFTIRGIPLFGAAVHVAGAGSRVVWQPVQHGCFTAQDFASADSSAQRSGVRFGSVPFVPLA